MVGNAHGENDFEALYNFDKLNAHVRTNDGNVMRSQKASGAGLVDVICQPWPSRESPPTCEKLSK